VPRQQLACLVRQVEPGSDAIDRGAKHTQLCLPHRLVRYLHVERGRSAESEALSLIFCLTGGYLQRHLGGLVADLRLVGSQQHL
jgi:hypothetical protein